MLKKHNSSKRKMNCCSNGSKVSERKRRQFKGLKEWSKLNQYLSQLSSLEFLLVQVSFIDEATRPKLTNKYAINIYDTAKRKPKATRNTFDKFQFSSSYQNPCQTLSFFFFFSASPNESQCVTPINVFTRIKLVYRRVIIFCFTKLDK